MTAAHDNSDLHELIDHLEPEQAEELRRHALRLAKPKPSRFRVLRTSTVRQAISALGPRTLSVPRSVKIVLIGRPAGRYPRAP